MSISYSYYNQYKPVAGKRYKDRIGRSLMSRTAADLPLPPRNPNYEDVGPVVHTGPTMRVDQMTFTRVHRDTTHGTIKPGALARLLANVLEPESEHEDQDETGSQDLSGFLDRSGDLSSSFPKRPSDGELDILVDEDMKKRLEDLGLDVTDIADQIYGKNEAESQGVGLTEEALAEADACFFLLVDVREQDEYDKCHILGSINFPASQFSRSLGYLSPEIDQLRGRDDRVIILYAVEEKRSVRVAHTMFEKGFDNIMVLGGGMKAFVSRMPREFLSAPPPPEAQEHPTARRGRGRGRPSSVTSFRTVGTRRSMASLASRKPTVGRRAPSGGVSVRGGHATEIMVANHLKQLPMPEPLPEEPPKPVKQHVPRVMRGRGRGVSRLERMIQDGVRKKKGGR